MNGFVLRYIHAELLGVVNMRRGALRVAATMVTSYLQVDVIV